MTLQAVTELDNHTGDKNKTYIDEQIHKWVDIIIRAREAHIPKQTHIVI